jgi:acetolactate synthase-1/2/3 large subunit
VALTGDAGLNMSLGDLETIKRVGAPVTVIVVNNSASGYVKALQHLMYGGNYQSSDLTEIDYSAVAKAIGLEGIRVEDPAQLRPTLIEAFQETSRAVIVDVAVTRNASEMLPGVDRRTRAMRADDRIA